MPDLSQIKTLVLISEMGSLASVARLLGVSPAAVSKQITKLENELGVQLLWRTTRRIELTEVGINYCFQCRRILEEVDVASSLISHIKMVPAGLLNVVSGRHFAASFIVPYMKEFLSTFPEIELNLELAERIPDLSIEPIDVVIGMSISATGDAVQKRIATTTYTFCASPDYLNEFGTPQQPEDLIHHRYIAHSMRRPENRIAFSDKKEVTVVPYLRVNDSQTMLSFAIQGLGVVMLHDYVVAEHLRRGELVQVLANYSDFEIPIYVSYSQRRFVSSKVRCFIDFITNKLK